MALILAFDTSAAHCAAALLSDDACLVRHEPMATGQAERLLPLLEELLAEGGADWRDLTALGVGIGPGNFTGVRIAVAAARGLALALGVPAAGVSTLRALAFGQDAIAAQDARRGMAWVQPFAATGAARAEAALCAADGPLPFDPGPAPVFVGDLAVALAARHGGIAADPCHPLPETIARLARADASGPLPRPAPLYLRPADAAPPRDPPPRILA